MLKKIILISSLIGSLAFSDILSQSGNKDGYNISLNSEKSLTVGSNTLNIEFKKDTIYITDLKVKMKVFMPEMPGMPYMEYEGKAEFKNDKYIVDINFPMSGTWQYQLKFKTTDGETHLLKGSLNI